MILSEKTNSQARRIQRGVEAATGSQEKDEGLCQLEAQWVRLQNEVKQLKTQLFRFANIGERERELEFLTSLNKATWSVSWELLDVSPAKVVSAKSAAKEAKGREIANGNAWKRVLNQEDQLLLTPTRFRLGRLQEELSLCDH